MRVKGEMGNVLKRVELLFKEGRYEEIKHHARVKTAEKTKGMKGKIRSGAFLRSSAVAGNLTSA